MKFRIENPLSACGASGFLVMLAVFLNAFLAFASARGINIGQMHVIAGEICIVGMASLLIGMRIGTYRNILPPALFIVAIFVTFLWVSLMNDSINLKAIRDMILVVVFFMLGAQCSLKNLISVFRFISAIVLAFMVVEAFATDLYVWFFEPAKYFASTRGIAEATYDDSGLYMASLGYAGRFSYNFLSAHRLSSIFLEQVSLGNFAIILSMFISCFWKDIGRWDRVLFLAIVPLIILTTSSRMASILCVVVLIGHFLFPLLPRFSNLLYMPAILLFMILGFYDPNYTGLLMDDNFAGRLTHAASNLGNLDMALFTGGTPAQATLAGDTGFTYIILTQTCIGLIVFWLFNALAVSPNSTTHKRFLHGSALYIFANLSVSGTSIFSIKTAVLLWVIAGFLCYEESMNRHHDQHERIPSYV